MFARVQTIHQPVERLDELTKLAREQLAATPTPPGFQGFYHLVDRDNGKALVISFWDTVEDLRQMEARNGSVREHIEAEARLESPVAERFEVTIHAEVSGP